MAQFEFKKSNRRCSVSQREFESGEEFVSALIEVEEKIERVDFALDAWDSATETYVGWWKSRMPDLNSGKVYWAPNQVLLSYFVHVYEQAHVNPDVTYVVAILMVQKRILQMIENDESTDPPTLVVHHRKTKTDFRIPTVELSGQRVNEIQEQLAESLFTNSRPTGDDPEATE